MCCLIRRPQYFASVIRFGSRGPGRKVWPRKKSEKWDNLSHLFTEPISSGGRELYEHSERGTAREWQFELLAFGLMLTAQIKRLIWIQKVIYWIRSIVTFKPQANTDFHLFFGSLPGGIQQICNLIGSLSGRNSLIRTATAGVIHRVDLFSWIN